MGTDLRFPLDDGDYYIAHGGAQTTINYHHAFAPQRFALDVVQLNRWGWRATGLFPRELTAYTIFGTTVVSPCSGQVIGAVDGLPDLPTGETDRKNVAGNHVVLRCDSLRIELAHLRQHSVRVQTGDVVDAGTPIGAVGNSGNTSEPHLHIHATAGGDNDAGVPLTFAGRFLVRNDAVRQR